MTRRSTHAFRLAAVALMGITVVGLLIADSATATVHSGDPACRSSQLAVWRAEPGDPALGSVYYELQFSNVSDRACSLQGFPRVVAAGDSDNQVGAAAAREPGSTPDRVVLRPGATAHAVLHIVDVANWPDNACKSTSVAALRIYPPATRQDRTLPFRFGGCTTSTAIYLHVSAVRPGAGIPGYSD